MTYTIGLILACAICLLGRSIAKNPEAASKLFTFGQTPTNFTVGFFRILGYCFFSGFALGAISYMALISLALLGPQSGH